MIKICLWFSGTAAGSLFLPFLINALVETYAFSGTLLVLGGCMLHISISATLYRPLAVHALISKQNRNVVQLHEATHETIEEQQNLIPSSVVNKENVENQNHMKKLQHQCPHHQHQTYDPGKVQLISKCIFNVFKFLHKRTKTSRPEVP